MTVCLICEERNGDVMRCCSKHICSTCIKSIKDSIYSNTCPFCRSSIEFEENSLVSDDVIKRYIKKFPNEIYAYDRYKITPSKYIPTFYSECLNRNHSISIEKPYGVVIVCNTCNKRKGYNWLK